MNFLPRFPKILWETGYRCANQKTVRVWEEKVAAVDSIFLKVSRADSILSQIRQRGYVVNVFLSDAYVEIQATPRSGVDRVQFARCDGRYDESDDEYYRCARELAKKIGIHPAGVRKSTAEARPRCSDLPSPTDHCLRRAG